MEWSHEKDVMFKHYAGKYALNRLSKKEKHAYEILKEQRREHLRDKEQEKRTARQNERIDKLLTAYKKLISKFEKGLKGEKK